MNTAILLYDGFTALDAIGPYEVLSRLPGARATFVAAEAGPVRTDNRMLSVSAECSLDELPAPEIVLVPGGPGEVAARAGGPALDWLRSAHETSTWTTSVCTGSLILAAAGLLDGKIATAAGVSAGIDMALALAARIAGDDVAQAIQLGIEYDPQPPFDAGSPQKAPQEIVAMLRANSRFVVGEEALAGGS